MMSTIRDIEKRFCFIFVCALSVIFSGCGRAAEDSGHKTDNDIAQHIEKQLDAMGMRQRLGLAQAVMEQPDILLLDEPMNGLDAYWQERTRELLLQMRDEGKTILLASHNKDDIELLCDRMIRLENGKVVADKKAVIININQNEVNNWDGKKKKQGIEQ